MESARYARVKELFSAAHALDEDGRRAFLARECGDPEVRAEVEDLLAHAAHAAPDFLAGMAEPARSAPPRLEIPGFQRLELLAEGGSGIVYRAEQESPRRTVALKLLRLDTLIAGQVARFRREAEILASLSHPGIAQVYNAGVIDSAGGPLPWIALEYVHGVTLGAHVARRRPGTRALLELFVAVCEALEHAHRRGIVHRDLKPSNVMVDEAGRPRVLDFGVARSLAEGAAEVHTRTGMLIGTLAYMAPEQTLGLRAAIDARTDVYALGVMLFELLSGRLPFAIDGLSEYEIVQVVREVEPERLRRLRPELPPDLETIVGKALEKDPARRYADAGALARDLENLLAERPVLARRPTVSYQLRKFVRRNRLLTGSALAVFLALAGGLFLALSGLSREHEARAATSAVVDVFARRIFDFAPQLGIGEEQRAPLQDVLAQIERQLTVDGGNRELHFARARALYELLQLDQAGQDNRAAQARAELARAELERLVSDAPADLDAPALLSQVYAKLGETARDLGDPAGRDAWFARALALDEARVHEHPGELELVEDLGWSLCRAADHANAEHEPEEAFRLARRRLADAEQLVRAEPDNWKYLYNLSNAQSYVARGLAERGKLDEALAEALECVRHARRLLELQPSRRDFVTWCAFACRCAGDVCELSADAERARAYAHDALDMATAAAFGDPRRADHLHLVRICGTDVAYLELDAGQPDLARASVRRMRDAAELGARLGAPQFPRELLSAATDLVEAHVEQRAASAPQSELARRGFERVMALAVDRRVGATDWPLVRGVLLEFADREPPPRTSELVREFCERVAAGDDPERTQWFARALAVDPASLVAGPAAER